MTIKGDLNGDGRITLEDLKLVEAYLLGFEETTNAILESGDINSDGTIDVVDFAAIKRHLLGIKIINEVIE